MRKRPAALTLAAAILTIAMVGGLAVVFLRWALIPAFRPPQPDLDHVSARYLLIRRHFWGGTVDDMPSRALLITDPQEIEKVRALLAAGLGNNHACGFDWEVEFWANPFDMEADLLINERCSEYDPGLEPYLATLRERPTHSIYILKLPTQIETVQAMKDLERKQRAVFVVHCSVPQLPRVTIGLRTYAESEDADWADTASRGEAAVRSLAERLGEGHALGWVGPVECSPFSDARGKGCEASAVVRFRVGEDLTGIEAKVASLGGVVTKKTIPRYFVELVTEETDIDKVRRMIMDDLGCRVEVWRLGADSTE